MSAENKGKQGIDFEEARHLWIDADLWKFCLVRLDGLIAKYAQRDAGLTTIKTDPLGGLAAR